MPNKINPEVVLPAEAKQYIKVDDRRFYVSSVTNSQLDASVLTAQLEDACRRVMALGQELRAAAQAGVGSAASAAAVFDAAPSLASDTGAAAFLAALRAARGAPE